jgi:uncharacterized membrane protein
MPPGSLARISLPYAHWRAIVATGFGLAVGGIVLALGSLAVAVLAGWCAGALVMLILEWSFIWTFDASATASHAAAQDPGRRLVYVLVLLTATVSLFSAVVVARNAEVVAPDQSSLVVYLSLSTVAASWLLAHTSFTLRYAHLYYRDDDEGVGGIDFPGNAPATYFDFAYFGFTIGMCFQVSDATITSQQVRRTALLHSMVSFAYNTAILAFALNLAFGSFG